MFFEDQEFVDPTFGDDLFSILESLEAEFPLATTPPPPPPPPLPVLDEMAVFCSKERDEACSSKNKRQKVMNGGGSCSDYYENQQDGQQQNRMSHITVERNRRKQMNEHLAVLRSLMPCFYVKRVS